VANTREIEVHTEGIVLAGTLWAPREAPGLVILATPSARGRFSAQRRCLAAQLRQQGLATLLIDLLTSDEEQGAVAAGEFRFDLELLGRRLLAATHWIAHHPDTLRMRIGCLDGPIGPGVALDAAARRPHAVRAVVSIGASPHVARKYVGRSKAPTLWLVGERDATVLHLDPRQIAETFGEADLEIVGGAGPLFAEPFALQQAGAIAGRWFARQLLDQPPPALEAIRARQLGLAADPAR